MAYNRWRNFFGKWIRINATPERDIPHKSAKPTMSKKPPKPNQPEVKTRLGPVDDNLPGKNADHPLPRKIAKYQIKSWLGSGQHGDVYLGFDPFVFREVAVKTSKAESPEDDNLFFVEARAAGKLQHPFIVSLYDAGVEAGLQYIVMEYIKGKPLSRFCSKTPGFQKLPIEKAVEAMYQCCTALNYSHRHKVLHRDIKPSNVMISEAGDAKIMDFSIASIMEKEIRPDVIIGSPVYLAPEQISREQLTWSTDMFSLSVLFYYIIGGTPPLYSAELRRLLKMIVTDTPKPLSQINPDVPKSLSLFMEKAMRKKPSDRFDSGEEMSEQLNEIMNSLFRRRDDFNDSSGQNALRRLKFFSGFNDKEIQEIMDNSSWERFNEGDLIIMEGETGSNFFIIISGEVEVRKSGVTVDRLRAGDVIGEIGFLTSHHLRTASIIAKGPVLVLISSVIDLDAIAESTQIRFYKVFSASLIYRLSLTTARLVRR